MRSESQETDASDAYGDKSPGTPQKYGKGASLNDVGSLQVHRIIAKDGNVFMGSAYRNPITGEVHLHQEAAWPDFDLSDLWTRPRIGGSLGQFIEEDYLFLPVPMAYRTWIYHDMFLQKKVLLGKDKEHAMVAAALSARCIDVNTVSAGRWSPLMCYGPIVLLTCLTGDMITVMPGVLCVALFFVISLSMNKPLYYRYLRLVLLPVRLFLLVIMLGRVEGSHAMPLLGFCAAIGLMIVDFFCGDMQTLMWYRLNCSYEIIKILPGRVFICRRHGASHQEDVFGARGSVAESITGLGAWQRNFYLIADIHGILCELRPVDKETWYSIYDEHCDTGRKLTFLGMDVFSEDFPAINAFGARFIERQAVIEKFKSELPANSLLFLPQNQDKSQWAEVTSLDNQSTSQPWKRHTSDFSVEETDF